MNEWTASQPSNRVRVSGRVGLFSPFLPLLKGADHSARSSRTRRTMTGGLGRQQCSQRVNCRLLLPLFSSPFFLVPLTQFTSIISRIKSSAAQHVDDEEAGHTLHCPRHWNGFLFTTIVKGGSPLSTVPFVRKRKILLISLGE